MVLTLFHVFYSTSFTFLFLLLSILVLIPAADGIAQAYLTDKQIYNIFVISGTYVLTAVLALTLYLTRLFAHRQVLADIPKHYVPIKKHDLPNGAIHKAVSSNLSRSAIVAAQSRPSSENVVVGGGGGGEGGGGGGGGGLHLWGEIVHPGWTSPVMEDMPNVAFRKIVEELPYIIEAKAVSLRPSSSSSLASSSSSSFSTSRSGSSSTSSSADVEFVKRQPHMTLRAYLAHLASLGYIYPPLAIDVFITRYEKARFRNIGSGIEEREFRELMKIFAGLLRGMGTSPAAAAAAVAERDGEGGWDGGLDRTSLASFSSYRNRHHRHQPSAATHRKFGVSNWGYDTTTTTDYDDDDPGYGFTPERISSTTESQSRMITRGSGIGHGGGARGGLALERVATTTTGSITGSLEDDDDNDDDDDDNYDDDDDDYGDNQEGTRMMPIGGIGAGRRRRRRTIVSVTESSGTFG